MAVNQEDAPAIPLRVAMVEQVRAIEQACFASTPSYTVMQAAGMAVVEQARGMHEPFLCVAGAGNNGGDALIAARLLSEQGVAVQVWLPLGEPASGSDAAKAYAELKDTQVQVLDQPEWSQVGCVIDGLFGIGLSRDLTDEAATVVAAINASAAPVVAIDVPSGIDADSGSARGVAVQAHTTVTFFTHKPGLLTGAGKAAAGVVQVAQLAQEQFIAERGGVCIEGLHGCAGVQRSEDAHKGSNGTLAVVGGAAGMSGALVLASRAAVAHGAGKVFAVTLDDHAPAFDPLAPEVMWCRELPPSQCSAIAFGVGAGTALVVANRLRIALQRNLPFILDADGLNLVAEHAWLRQKLADHTNEKIMTPHPAEAGRLLNVPTAEVQHKRVAVATKIAREFGCTVVLKGSGSVVADPHGQWGIVAAGNPGLAQAGSGDLLTGIIGALLAQGCSAWSAAASGAWLHAAGADAALSTDGGTVGVPLAEICACSSSLLNQELAA